MSDSASPNSKTSGSGKCGAGSSYTTESTSLGFAVGDLFGMPQGFHVTFMDGPTSLGTATLVANSAQLSIASLAAGIHSITAVYSGDTNMASSARLQCLSR